jgi:uncharacterized protein YbaR (Trm112 family)
MKRRLLQYLICPSCEQALSLANITVEEDAEIIEGELKCLSCQATFPVVRGIPRFAVPERIQGEKAATAASFGWQWQHFTQQDDRYEEQFLGWIAPVARFFATKSCWKWLRKGSTQLAATGAHAM